MKDEAREDWIRKNWRPILRIWHNFPRKKVK